MPWNYNNKKAVRRFPWHPWNRIKEGYQWHFKMMFGWFNTIGTVYLKLLSQTYIWMRKSRIWKHEYWTLSLLFFRNLAEYDYSNPLFLMWEGDWKQVGSISWTSSGKQCNFYNFIGSSSVSVNHTFPVEWISLFPSHDSYGSPACNFGSIIWYSAGWVPGRRRTWCFAVETLLLPEDASWSCWPHWKAPQLCPTGKVDAVLLLTLSEHGLLKASQHTIWPKLVRECRMSHSRLWSLWIGSPMAKNACLWWVCGCTSL